MTRLVNRFATLSIVLALVGGVPSAVASGAAACGWCSSPEAINLQALRAGQLPAEAAVSRDGARTNVAATGRSLPFTLGMPSAGILFPAPVVSGILAFALGPSVPSVWFSSSSVRGPPSTI